MLAWIPGRAGLRVWIPVNVLVALAAAAAGGGGDFCGGMAVKNAQGSVRGALRVVITAHAVSLAALLGILALWPEARPAGALLAWGLAAGVAAGGSLAAFYIALSRGAMGAAAAVSGLLTAAIPALVSRYFEGAPSTLRLAGFVLAAAAIWLIAVGPAGEKSAEPASAAAGTSTASRSYRGAMLLAVLGGLGFGFYFVAMRMDNRLGAVEPVALARAGSIATCTLLLIGMGRRGSGRSGPPLVQAIHGERSGNGGWLTRSAAGWAVGVALLDSGGNLLYLEATRLGRLDVASVLAALYPASTILLAAWLLQERLSGRQIAGMGVALGAVILITL